MSQTLRQRRVLCDRNLSRSRDEPAVLRIQPPATPAKRIIREDAPTLGMLLRITLWALVVTAAMGVKLGFIPTSF